MMGPHVCGGTTGCSVTAGRSVTVGWWDHRVQYLCRLLRMHVYREVWDFGEFQDVDFQLGCSTYH